MSVTAPLRSEPSTPKKKTPRSGPTPVEDIIRQLNAKYNLGIDLYDKNLTPSHRRERAKVDIHFAQCDKIASKLQFLHYEGGQGILDKALDAFRRESRAACLKWISKPLGDRDTLPFSSEPRRASTPGEQNELQEILLQILEQLVLFLREIGGDGTEGERGDSSAIPSRPPQLKPKPKRPSNEGLENSSKRVKSQQRQAQPSHVTAAIDKIPGRKINPEESMQSIFQQPSSRSLNRSFYNTSADTSKASLAQSVFSEVEALSPSQSTADPGSQNPKKPRLKVALRPPSTVDSFPPSPGDIQALAESFSRFDEPEAEVEVLNDRRPNVSAGKGPPRSPSQAHLQRISSPAHSSEYSSISGLLDAPLPDVTSEPQLSSSTLEARLKNIWPKSPPWYDKAPLAVVWEFTRVCLHCGIDADQVGISFDPAWADPQSHLALWLSLRKHPSFSSKAFPEPPDGVAWAAALKGFRLQNMAVILSASLDFSLSKDEPLFTVRLNPLKLEKSCRLNRRFGSDRFFEVLVPSTHGRAVPDILKDDASVAKLIHWLTCERHSIFGRRWAAFFVADAGYRKPLKELRTSPDAKPLYKERIHLFAEYRSESSDTLNVGSVEEMLDWLLQFKLNEDQPYLKLFSRIQLGLSKTDPIIELKQHQIIHHEGDIKSPTGNPMNDGIGRVSVSIARKVQRVLGLTDLPSAIQGRMGSAKGMWIVDVASMATGASATEDDWIETYYSQRKWNCDQTDPFQRTLEVHAVSHELRSAGLNLQFLPVLEDRARDQKRMRETIGQRMADHLRGELSDLNTSMKSPLQFRLWVRSKASSARGERVHHGQVPFLGGLPKRTEETLSFLLDGGFDPKKQFYLQEQTWKMQLQNCEVLKKKLNIRIGQSAYMYMVVDFWNVLEENEVHVGFSSKFQDPNCQSSNVLLHDVDVLVARSPAHLVSDIQKVRAVFKTELRALKDVIVFSAKGNVPLADKLSGGDYDGDKAWVCWDPDIVDNFDNAEVPEPSDLSAFLGQDKTTFGELVRRARKNRTVAIQNTIELSFRFNMGQSLLGQCTNYKEKLCYIKNEIGDEVSLILGTLLSKLVDQAKQGILFDSKAWDRLRKHLKIPLLLDDPAYKSDNWTGSSEPTHIIDYLKFTIVKKTVERELEAAYKELSPGGIPAPKWDEDLAKPFHHFEKLAESSTSCQNLLTGLKNSLGEVYKRWGQVISKDKDDASYGQRVTEVYDMWHAIQPAFAGRQTRSQDNSKVVALLLESYLTEDRPSYELSQWSLLKASATFKMYYNKRTNFVWQIAGRQLQAIKAKVSFAKAGKVCIPVGPLMYAGLNVDKRFVEQYTAMMEGQSSDYFGLDEENDDEEEDDA